ACWPKLEGRCVRCRSRPQSKEAGLEAAGARGIYPRAETEEEGSMRKALAFTLALFAASLMTAAVSLGRQDDRPRISNGPKIKALVFHKTTGYRHASIPYAIEQLKAYGDANGIDVTADQTSAQFTDAGLAKY